MTDEKITPAAAEEALGVKLTGAHRRTGKDGKEYLVIGEEGNQIAVPIADDGENIKVEASEVPNDRPCLVCKATGEVDGEVCLSCKGTKCGQDVIVRVPCLRVQGKSEQPGG